MNIDFDSSEDGIAKAIYLALGAKKGNNSTGSISSLAQSPKSKTTYLLLTFFLGGLGVHKFYMGSWGWGILYIIGSLFFLLGAIASIVEFIRFLIFNEEQFQEKIEVYQKSNPGPFSFFW